MGCSCCWLSGGNLWLGQPTMTYPTYPVVGVAGTRSAAPKPALHCIACSLRNFDYGMQQGPRQLTGCLNSLDRPFYFLSGSPLHLSHSWNHYNSCRLSFAQENSRSLWKQNSTYGKMFQWVFEAKACLVVRHRAIF